MDSGEASTVINASFGCNQNPTSITHKGGATQWIERRVLEQGNCVGRL